MEKLVLEGERYKGIFLGELEADHTYDDPPYQNEIIRSHYQWKGQASIKDKQTNQRIGFLFKQWNDYNSRDSVEDLEKVVISIRPRPDESKIIYPKKIIDKALGKLYEIAQELNQEEDVTVPDLSFHYLNLDDLIKQGIVADSSAQIHLALATA
ncbi:MAG: hypothetical protein Q8L27_01780 [archaeon]|nr:hypothetical protein [archaeon]